MELQYYQLSWKGPVRQVNEDFLGFHQPTDAEEWRKRGAISIICDGVGGQGDGDIASRLAVETVLKTFSDVSPGTSPSSLLRQMFNAANLAVYDASVANTEAKTRMATTMTAALFRHHEVHVGHVGDCRLYHIHAGEIRRVTTDHSYTGMQMKLGLISAAEAANSDLRTVLTRSMGKDPTVQVDFYSLQVLPGDFIVMCCDGVYTCMSETEMADIVKRWPELACSELIDLCTRRGADDNLSVQIIQVRRVERVTYYRGLPLYQTMQDQSMDQDLHIDQILDGRYQILEQISRSGMASIYRALDLQTGQPVALKVPYMQFESDPSFFTRFEREEQIGTKMRHPYILRVDKPPDLEKSRPYLVMEYLQGQTLGKLMKNVKPLPVADALKIASRICDALQYLHDNNVIHRDLKPDNIMICDDGSIRLMDFGIAKMQGARRLTFGKFQPAMGTPDYMAPEQVRGQRGDVRTDIYSLGAMLYEMVTGSPPFEGANPLVIMNSRLTGDPVAPRAKNPEIPPTVEEIILHAMTRKPDDRYATVAALRHDLDYPFEVPVTGRADRLQPVKPVRASLRPYLAMLIPLAIALVFLLFFLFTRVYTIQRR